MKSVTVYEELESPGGFWMNIDIEVLLAPETTNPTAINPTGVAEISKIRVNGATAPSETAGFIIDVLGEEKILRKARELYSIAS